MKNFFFAPSKATVESPEALAFLYSLGHVRFAEANAQANTSFLRRLKISEARPDVDFAACILTAPTENPLLDHDTKISVGRGIYDIGAQALNLKIKTFIIRRLGQAWGFYPVIHLSTEEATGNWKLDYARAYIEPVIRPTELYSWAAKVTPPTFPDTSDVPF